MTKSAALDLIRTEPPAPEFAPAFLTGGDDE